MSVFQFGSVNLYIFITLISAVVAFFGALYTIRQKNNPNYTYITFLFITTGIWAVMDGLGVVIDSYNGKIAVAVLAYFGVAFVSPSIFMMSLIQTDLLHRTPKFILRMIWVIAGAYLILVFTNPMHKLYWRGFEWVDVPIPHSLQFLRGPLYNIFPYLYYMMLAASVILLVYSLSYSRGILRKQTFGLLASIILPWSGHIVWLAAGESGNNWDYTSQILIFSTVLMLINVNHWRLFDLIPIVENEIPNLIEDGIIVVDEMHRIIYHNNAVNKILGWGAQKRVGTIFRTNDLDEWIEFRNDNGAKKFINYKKSTIERASTARTANILLITDVTQKHLDDELIDKLENEQLLNDQRRALADDLHDSMAQGLYSLKLLSEEIIRSNKEGRPIDSAMTMMTSAIDYAISEFRMTLFNLQNTGNQTDLAEFIIERLSSVEDRVGLITTTDLTALPDLDPECVPHVTAIINEALNNTLIHAHATAVTIRAFAERDARVLQIEDDGIGFDPSKNLKGHFGLRNMKERAQKIKAELTISSKKGTGSLITLSFKQGIGE